VSGQAEYIVHNLFEILLAYVICNLLIFIKFTALRIIKDGRKEAAARFKESIGGMKSTHNRILTLITFFIFAALLTIPYLLKELRSK
jgi:hypothetical protein